MGDGLILEFYLINFVKLIWLSDIHFEFPTIEVVRGFISDVADTKPDAVLITADISNALRIEYHSAQLSNLPCKVHFALGNHDFYEGDFASVDATVDNMCESYSGLVHLGHGEIVRLTEATSLIGHRGWADVRVTQKSLV